MQAETPGEQPVGLLLAGARRRLKQAVLSLVSRRRLSPQQFWTIVAIWERDGMTLRALAERQRMDAPTASRIVEALRRRGLVRMEADRTDRRRRYLHLTPRGRALARELHPIASRTRHAVEAGFSDAERETLRAMLLRVIANVEAYAAGCRERAARPSARTRSGTPAASGRNQAKGRR